MPNLVELLEGRGYHLKPKGRDEYAGPCPWCGGTDRFVVKATGGKDGRGRWMCRQCPPTDGKPYRIGDTAQFLMEMDGLTFNEAKAVLGDYVPPKQEPEREKPLPKNGKYPEPKEVAWYDYTDADGKFLFQVVKRVPGKEGIDKDFYQRHKGKRGQWINNMKGVRLVLYGLEGGIAPDGWCLFLEGEKDVERARSLGLPATTNPMGAEKVPKLQEEWNILEPLRGIKVWVIPDMDKSGLKHAEQVCSEVYDIADEVRFVKLPGEKWKTDFSDWVDEVNDDKAAPEILKGRINEFEAWHPPKISFTGIELLELKFPNEQPIIGNGILPSREVMLISGPTAIGKSILRMHMTIHMAGGMDWIGFPIPSPRKVIVFQYENPFREEQSRLKKMLESGKFDPKILSDIIWMDRSLRFDISKKPGRDKLMELAKKMEGDVYVWDCLSNIHTAEENDNAKMRHVMDFFAELNDACQSSSVVIHHFGKSNSEIPIQNMTARGAQSIQDAAATSFTYNRKFSKDGWKFFLKCDIIRSGPLPPMVTLESDNHFWLQATDEESMCPPTKVAEILQKEFGGECESKKILVSAIVAEVGCSDRTAHKAIDLAVENMRIVEVVTGENKRSKGYATAL